MAAYPGLVNPVYVGTTPFEYVYENYTEQFAVRGAGSQLKVRVAWEDKDDFVADVMGYTTGVIAGATYQRNLPLAHPGIPNLWCTDAQLIGYAASDLANANQPDILTNGMFQTDWAIYALTFTRPKFDLLTDSQLDEFGLDELGRYMIPAYRPRAREFTVSSYGLIPENPADGTAPLPLPSFIMSQEQDLVVTQLQVPAELVPYDAIDACIGRINNSVFSLPIPPGTDGGLYTLRMFAPDTLLFRGLATDVVPYEKPSGPGFYNDLPFVFTIRPKGWNAFPRPDGNGDYVGYKYANISPTKRPYDEADFSTLFMPAS